MLVKSVKRLKGFITRTILDHGRSKIRHMLSPKFFSVSQVIRESWEVFILHWRCIWHYYVPGDVKHRPLWFVFPVSSCTGARQFNHSGDELGRWRTQMPVYRFYFSSSGIWVWLAFDRFLLQTLSSCYVASLLQRYLVLLEQVPSKPFLIMKNSYTFYI